jgi:hypothetical protein
MRGGGGEASGSTGRVEGVDSLCPTPLEGFAVRVVGPEAGVVWLEAFVVDFVVTVVIALSSDPRPPSKEKSRSS